MTNTKQTAAPQGAADTTQATQTGQDMPPAGSPAAPPDASMDKVRSLLFGSQMRDYERRLAELSDRLASEAARLSEEQSARLAKLDTFLRSELERLTNQDRQERQERAAAIEDLAGRLTALQRDLSTRISDLDGRVSQEALDLRGALREQAAEQAEALLRTRQELTAGLERERARLHDEKTSRDELAQLFTELALRLNRDMDLPAV